MPASKRWLSSTSLKLLRIAFFALLGIAAIVLSLLLLHRGVLPVLAWCLPQLETWFYDLAVFGVYRTEDYTSYRLPSPRGVVSHWDERCDDGFVFIGPYGDSVMQEGPVILDSRGELVWMSDEYGTVTNFEMQRYRGENYLTFWSGKKSGGTGKGELFMLDSTYRMARKVQAVGRGLMADIHEFQLTKDDTALLTAYNTTVADLRAMGWGRGEDGWVADSLFQEVDIATGELLFQWSALEHFKPEASYYWSPFQGYVSSMGFDFFHINSVEKDSRGNYLISARHFHIVTYLNGTSGDIIWILGGGESLNQFEDLSDGLATGFSWQHHARWFSEEEGIVSIMDNAYAGPLQTTSTDSKAILVQLDQDEMTATHLQSYDSLVHIRAASQGSVQRLPNGNVFVGWGSSAAYSEFLQDGTLLCESHFGASWSFSWERVKSYRAYKFHGWVGTPEYPPSAKIEGDNLFVSWNGATEVKYWQLQGLRNEPRDGLPVDEAAFETIDLIEKHSFEEVIALTQSREFTRFRVGALDSKEKLLRYSKHVKRGKSAGISRASVIASLCACLASMMSIWYLLRVWKRRRPKPKVLDWISMRTMFRWDQYRYNRLPEAMAVGDTGDR